MLPQTLNGGTAAFSFELAGRLSDDGARELEQAWCSVSSIIGDLSLIVDLSYVTGIDVIGQELLRRWHDRGAQLVAKSPAAGVLVQSITGQSIRDMASLSESGSLGHCARNPSSSGSPALDFLSRARGQAVFSNFAVVPMRGPNARWSF
jgi:hypothetical protein